MAFSLRQSIVLVFHDLLWSLDNRALHKFFGAGRQGRARDDQAELCFLLLNIPAVRF
jgi:hypothetical protein